MDNKIFGAVPFGLEEKALKLCEDRASILAHNIANTSTPKYKARDIDFHNALKQAHSSYYLKMSNNHHLPINSDLDGQKLAYRIPMQSSLDENTVDDEIERKNFVENALHYQANLSFAQGKAANLLKAIKGE